VDRAHSGGPPLGDVGRRRAGLGGDRQPRAGDVRVLLCGGIGKRDELVHFEEGAPWLRHLDPHATGPRRVAGEVSVGDGLVEDRGEACDQLSERRWTERADPPSPAIAQLRACLERVLQLRGFLELVCFELKAVVRRDLADAVFAEEREDVVREAGAVVGLRVRANWPIAEQTGVLVLKPLRRVLVKGGRPRCLPALGQLPLPPHARSDLREDVLELDLGGALIPSAAAAAFAVTPLVQYLHLAPALYAEAQLEDERPVAEGLDDDVAACVRGHVTSRRGRW
jgi:hypothetical protein